MANFELKFFDYYQSQKAQIKNELLHKEGVINIQFTTKDGEFIHPFIMDKSTAIKFAKTLRTEINKITAREEGNNG